MNFRSWVKKTKAGRILWRVVIGIIGGAVTVVGTIAIPAPGPGVLILLAGLGILATEFAWAGRVMMRTKEIAAKAAERTGMKPWVKYFLISGGAVFSIIMIYLGCKMTLMMYEDEYARTATLQIPEYFFYAILPLMGFMMFLRTLIVMREDWTGKHDITGGK